MDEFAEPVHAALPVTQRYVTYSEFHQASQDFRPVVSIEDAPERRAVAMAAFAQFPPLWKLEVGAWGTEDGQIVHTDEARPGIWNGVRPPRTTLSVFALPRYRIVPHATLPAAQPTFWRDDALPFVEVRAIADGRKVRYGRHAHRTFSVGAVTGGHSTYLNGRTVEHIGAGTVVVINPDTVHACNPAESAPWSYRMFYLDVAWLTSLQHDAGFAGDGRFRPFLTTWTMRTDLFDGLNRLYALLTDVHADTLQKHGEVIDYVSTLQQALNPAPASRSEPNHRLARAAEYIDDNYTRPLKLDDICEAANLSASYLVRAFKAQYGMTPHAYMVNRRIEFSRTQLRRGHAIADVAAEAGFADQAHLQRAFRQFVAATPGQYRG